MNTYGFTLYALKDPLYIVLLELVSVRQNLTLLQDYKYARRRQTIPLRQYAWIYWYSLQTVDMLEIDILNLFFSTNIFNDSPELGSAKMIEI